MICVEIEAGFLGILAPFFMKKIRGERMKETNTSKFNVNLAVLATGIMAFSGVLIETAMNVTFPTLIKQFGIGTADVQWVTTIYLLMIAIIVPLSSFLIKNYCVRDLFFCSILLFIAGVALNSLPINFAVLLAGRLLQGVATGIALPLMFNIILTKVPLSKRGLMIGIGTLTTSIAPALGPTYGGILTSTIGWHYIYVILLPILVITMVVGLYAMPKEVIKKSGQLNWGAAGALAVLFSAILLSFSFFGQGIFWLFLFIVLLSAALFFKLNKKNILINLKVFKNRAFSGFLFGFVVFQSMLLGISFIIPNFMQLAMDIPSSKAGLMMFPGALIGAIFAPISGRILDSIGAKKPIVFGIVIALVGWGILSVVVPTGVVSLTILGHVIFMIGVGFSYSNLMSIGLSSITSAEQADGNAIFTTLQQLFGAISTAFVALIMALFQESASSFVEGTIVGAKVDLYIFFIILLVGLGIVFRGFKKEK